MLFRILSTGYAGGKLFVSVDLFDDMGTHRVRRDHLEFEVDVGPGMEAAAIPEVVRQSLTSFGYSIDGPM